VNTEMNLRVPKKAENSLASEYLFSRMTLLYEVTLYYLTNKVFINYMYNFMFSRSDVNKENLHDLSLLEVEYLMHFK
jgi:hypothetical protein